MPPDFTLPEIPGDPAGMRRLAGELRTDATNITSVAGRLSSEAAAMTFDGPAGNRFRSATQSETGDLSTYAERLTTVAGRLAAAADEVERLQAERLRKMEEMRREWAQSQNLAGSPS
jgi:uncharacterized protein YukE